jgi:hypothetical protein
MYSTPLDAISNGILIFMLSFLKVPLAKSDA